MMRRGKDKSKASTANDGAAKKNGNSSGEGINVSDREKIEDAIPGEFPGPLHADVQLRVAFEREAYAELIYHARSSLEAEICGVLVGRVKRDQEGVFVHVYAVIRGESTRQGSAHVTFTQETWNQIHGSLEKDHPNMRIVGWYHTHPGFGVAFSDMDLFIQKHFFPLPTQIALVTDPLSGETAISINTDDGPDELSRFWVNGREVRCNRQLDASGINEGNPPTSSKDFQTLESRISQFMHIENERRSRLYSAMMFVGMMVLSVVVVGAGLLIYRYYTAETEMEAPKIHDYGSIPVTFQIDGKTIVLNIQVQGMVIPSKNDRPSQVPPPDAQIQPNGGTQHPGKLEK